MRRYALPLLLFLGHAAIVTALTAVLVVLTSASRKPHPGEHFRVGPVAASHIGNTQTSPDGLLAPPEGHEPSPLQDGTRLQRSEPPSDDPFATAPSPTADAPPPDDRALDAAGAPAMAAQPSVNDQLAALQLLAALSQQESGQLGTIDDHLIAQRQQAADDESRRQSETEQKAASHAATVAALGTLRQAESLLANGNSDGVDDELARAEAALSGRTRLDVAGARDALERGDLFQAGQYVAAALAERRALR
jgi:hypothetical protein